MKYNNKLLSLYCAILLLVIVVGTDARSGVEKNKKYHHQEIKYELSFMNAKAIGDAVYGKKNPFRKIPDKSPLGYWQTRMLLNHMRQKGKAKELVKKVLATRNGITPIASGIKTLIMEKSAYALSFAIGKKVGTSLRNDGFASVMSDTAMVLGHYAETMNQCLENPKTECGTTKHPASTFGGYIEKGGGGYLDCYRWKVPSGYTRANIGREMAKKPQIHETLLVARVPGGVRQISSDWGQCNSGGATCVRDDDAANPCAGYAACDGNENYNGCHCLMEVDKEDCYTVELWE